MKKKAIYLCAGILAFALTACGGKDDGESSQPDASGTGEVQNTAEPSKEGSGDSQEGSDDAQGGSGSDAQTPDGGEEDSDSGAESGWSEEMSGFRAAVVEALGEDNYWPDTPMDSEWFQTLYGVSAELYEDYLAESPIIGNNKDTLIIVKAKEGSVDEVERLLVACRDAAAADTMQYPMNLGKVQAGMVEKIGNYVIYVMLGADTMDMETEDAIVHCQEANKQAIEAIRGKIES